METPMVRTEVFKDARLVCMEICCPFRSMWMLPRGSYKAIVEKYGVSERNVRRIWDCRKQDETAKEILRAIRKKPKSGWGRSRTNEGYVSENSMNVPYRLRQTYRYASESTGIRSSTLSDVLKRGSIRKQSNTLKPVLSSSHKMNRF